jgi:hypothetical protein
MADWELLSVPADEDGSYRRSYEWDYGSSSYTWEMELPRTVYRTHERRHRVYDYGAYVADEFTQQLVAGFCESVREKAVEDGFGRRETVAYVTRFVQSLPYTPDNVSTGYSNYPRYPVETLVDETGDCEDSSLLLASLLAGLGYRVGLLEFESHLGVGVALEDGPDNVTFDGVGYAYVETTGNGWEIGEVPPDHDGESVELHTIEDSPVLYAGWQGQTTGDAFDVAGAVSNRGEGPATDVEFLVRLVADGGEVVGGIQREWHRLAPGERVEWSDRGYVEPNCPVTPEWQLGVDGYLHDEGEGDRQWT